jgi:hypothetical protein
VVLFAVVPLCAALLHFTVRYAIALATIAALIWVLKSDYRQGFLLLVGSMLLGYRTVHVTEYLNIHPLEVLLALLLCSVLMSRPRFRTPNGFWSPLWVWCFIPFWVWGWIVGTLAANPWDLMLSYMADFVMLIPLFTIARAVLRGREQWQAVAIAYYVTATCIAVLGLFERCLPGAAGLMSGFFSNPAATSGQDGFARATFSFWGHPDAAFVCLLAMPFAVPIWSWRRTSLARTIILGALAIQIAGVYISGFRIAWLLLGLAFALFFFLGRRYLAATLAVAVFAVTYTALPAEVGARAESLVMTLEGRPIDTSGAEHLDRFWGAVDLVRSYPAGVGWSSSGWVHCDFLQVAGDLGILAGILFVVAYFRVLGRLGARLLNGRRDYPTRALHLALFISFCSAGGLLATQPIFVLPQVALPVWLIWVLGEISLRQQILPVKVFQRGASNLSSPPHFQLGGYGPRDPRVSQVG